MNRFDRLVSIILEYNSDEPTDDEITKLEKARPDLTNAVEMLMQLAMHGKSELAEEFIGLMTRSALKNGEAPNKKLPLDDDMETFSKLLEELDSYDWCVTFKDFTKLADMKILLLNLAYDRAAAVAAVTNNSAALGKLAAAGYFDNESSEDRLKSCNVSIASRFAELERNAG